MFKIFKTLFNSVCNVLSVGDVVQALDVPESKLEYFPYGFYDDVNSREGWIFGDVYDANDLVAVYDECSFLRWSVTVADGWEQRYDADRRILYVNHNDKRVKYYHPRSVYDRRAFDYIFRKPSPALISAECVLYESGVVASEFERLHVDDCVEACENVLDDESRVNESEREDQSLSVTDVLDEVVVVDQSESVNDVLDEVVVVDQSEIRDQDEVIVVDQSENQNDEYEDQQTYSWVSDSDLEITLNFIVDGGSENSSIVREVIESARNRLAYLQFHTVTAFHVVEYDYIKYLIDSYQQTVMSTNDDTVDWASDYEIKRVLQLLPLDIVCEQDWDFLTRIVERADERLCRLETCEFELRSDEENCEFAFIIQLIHLHDSLWVTMQQQRRNYGWYPIIFLQSSIRRDISSTYIAILANLLNIEQRNTASWSHSDGAYDRDEDFETDDEFVEIDEFDSREDVQIHFLHDDIGMNWWVANRHLLRALCDLSECEWIGFSESKCGSGLRIRDYFFDITLSYSHDYG